MPQEKGFFTTVFGLNDDIDVQNEVEAHQRRLLDSQRERGVVTEREYARLLEVSAPLDVEGIAREEFFSEVETRASNPFKLFDFVPWWVWVLAAAALAWQLGWLKKLLPKMS